MVWMIKWIAQFMGPASQAVLTYLSITRHLEAFMGGVIDTQHVVYYLSFIAFGLFLTARSVDVERWRG
jgi:ABC-2 type transport system permease protein